MRFLNSLPGPPHPAKMSSYIETNNKQTNKNQIVVPQLYFYLGKLGSYHCPKEISLSKVWPLPL